MKFVATVALVLLVISLQAQRLSGGVTLATHALQNFRLADNYVFPPHSYFVYYTENEKKDEKPVFNQYMKGLMFGINVNLEYKRFLLTSEIRTISTTFTLPLMYPTPLGSLLSDNWSYFRVVKSGVQLPVLLTVKLTDKANGLYVVLGGQYEWVSYNEPRFSLSDDYSSGILLYLAKSELYGVMYNEHDYFSYIAGLGLKNKNKYTSLRLVKRFGGNKALYPQARFYSVELARTVILNFQKLKKGHVIYIED
ncbi:MAG: hypothetical protein OEX02_07200 [Cyclobacteriaceae bacterium]|nr:hypothetical protein [Cyclobacteriaceae bacterium]